MMCPSLVSIPVLVHSGCLGWQGLGHEGSLFSEFCLAGNGEPLKA